MSLDAAKASPRAFGAGWPQFHHTGHKPRERAIMPEDAKTYEIVHPTAKGRAGAVEPKTRAVNVTKGGEVVARFRYPTGDADQKKAATKKARDYIKAQEKAQATTPAAPAGE